MFKSREICSCPIFKQPKNLERTPKTRGKTKAEPTNDPKRKRGEEKNKTQGDPPKKPGKITEPTHPPQPSRAKPRSTRPGPARRVARARAARSRNRGLPSRPWPGLRDSVTGARRISGFGTQRSTHIRAEDDRKREHGKGSLGVNGWCFLFCCLVCFLGGGGSD